MSDNIDFNEFLFGNTIKEEETKDELIENNSEKEIENNDITTETDNINSITIDQNHVESNIENNNIKISQDNINNSTNTYNDSDKILQNIKNLKKEIMKFVYIDNDKYKDDENKDNIKAKDDSKNNEKITNKEIEEKEILLDGTTKQEEIEREINNIDNVVEDNIIKENITKNNNVVENIDFENNNSNITNTDYNTTTTSNINTNKSTDTGIVTNNDSINFEEFLNINTSDSNDISYTDNINNINNADNKSKIDDTESKNEDIDQGTNQFNTNINSEINENIININDIDEENQKIIQPQIEPEPQPQEELEQTKNEKAEQIKDNKTENDDLMDEILKDIQNIPEIVVEEPKKFTIAELAEINEKEYKKEKEEKQNESKNEETVKKINEEEDIDISGPEDEKSIIERKRQKILSKKIILDENLKKEENIEGTVKTLKEIDLNTIDYNSFDNINEEHIDLYYILNDNKNNIEFLDEDLLAQSKKEEEIRALKKQEKEEFDFDLEKLVDDDKIKVDLTGLIEDLEKVN